MTVGKQLSFRQAWLLAEVEKRRLELLRRRFKRLRMMLPALREEKGGR